LIFWIDLKRPVTETGLFYFSFFQEQQFLNGCVAAGCGAAEIDAAG